MSDTTQQDHKSIMLQQMYSTAALSTSEVGQAEEMVLHQPDVRNHHVEDVFTHRLDVTVQLQLLAVQQHHANLPLHILHFTTFLVQRVGRRKRNRVLSHGFIVNRSIAVTQTAP